MGRVAKLPGTKAKHGVVNYMRSAHFGVPAKLAYDAKKFEPRDRDENYITRRADRDRRRAERGMDWDKVQVFLNAGMSLERAKAHSKLKLRGTK